MSLSYRTAAKAKCDEKHREALGGTFHMLKVAAVAITICSILEPSVTSSQLHRQDPG